MEFVVLSIGLVIFFAYAAAGLFQRTGVPDVLLLTLLGILIGPVLGFARPEDFGRVGPAMSVLALIVLLFEGGTSLDLHTLTSSLRRTVTLSLVAFAAAVAVVAGVGMAMLGLAPLPATIFGLVCAGTSSAVVIPIVRGLRMRESSQTILVMESAITDVLCIVGVYALVEAGRAGNLALGRLFGSVISSMAMATAIGLAGSLGWLSIVGRVRQSRNANLAALALVFVLCGIAELLGFSGGIAALGFGFGLTNHSQLRFDRLLPSLAKAGFEPITTTEKVFYQEAVFLLKTAFFVYLGLSIHLPKRADGIAILLVLTIYLSRALVTRFTVARSLDLREAAITAVMAPKGLAAAVLASVPLQAGIAGGEVIRDRTYLIVLVSIVLTAAMVPLIDRGRLKALFRLLLGPTQQADSRERQSVAKTIGSFEGEH